MTNYFYPGINGFMNKIKTFSAFSGMNLIVTGPLEQLLEAVWTHIQSKPDTAILIFDNSTGRQTDFNFTGSLDEVISRVIPEDKPKKGPGRPKLGVVCGEVSLMPRHWEWLEKQPKKASGTIRNLVENASKEISPEQLKKQTIEAAGNFMWAIGGNLPGFEEAGRALYGGKWQVFDALTAPWPSDITGHLNMLLQPVRQNTASDKWFDSKIARISALKSEYNVPDKITEPWKLSAVKLAEAVKTGKLKAVDIADSFIEETGGSMVILQSLREDAEIIDRCIANGEYLGPLTGVPFTADEASPAARKLKEAGAVFMGYTQTVPAEAESAVSASASAPLHIAGDICGSLAVSSVRKGLSALKPSYGRIASYSAGGSEAFASRLISVSGFASATVADLHLAFQITAGADSEDPRALPIPASGPEISIPFKVGIIRNPGGSTVDANTARAVDDASGVFARKGYEIIETELPELNQIAEASLRMLETETRYVTGTVSDSEMKNYLKLLMMRETWIKIWADYFRDFPVVLAPLPYSDYINSDEANLNSDSGRICSALGFMGYPAVSAPVKVYEGSYYGIQIISAMYREDLCLQTAALIEAER